uniref:ATP-binding protein n=1 Tax=Roseihalotalea indica TaxID=2867963 RepID=A0AA49JJ85_9BACT|nr:ATP-binding protein [Tunicatimonas sp. TK19036]
MEVSLMSLESERKRLSREIHDGIGPLLSLLNLYVHQLQEKQTDDLLTCKLSEVLKKTIREAHDISAKLSSSTLEQRGLNEALQEYCALASQSAALPIDLTCSISQHALHHTLLLSLYRITQELIHNAIKHSGATLIWVRLQEEDGCIKLQIRDNGIGFQMASPSDSTNEPHLGISNIQHRLSAFQGTILVTSGQPQGCQIQINIPLSKNSFHENHHSRRSLTV